MKLEDLALLLETARNLNEPGEVNGEYVRGQANLICDVSGVPFAGDVISDMVTRYISHEQYSLAAVLAKIALGRVPDCEPPF
jgi:hypothetical protein